MGRQRSRKDGSAAGALVDLVALMPWWLGVALALVAYVLLHQWASQPTPMPEARVTNAPAIIARGMKAAVAPILQVLVPGLILVDAGVSGVRRRQQNSPPANTKTSALAVRRLT